MYQEGVVSCYDWAGGKEGKEYVALWGYEELLASLDVLSDSMNESQSGLECSKCE